MSEHYKSYTVLQTVVVNAESVPDAIKQAREYFKNNTDSNLVVIPQLLNRAPGVEGALP